jgi:shikimate dehydrogenase
MQNAALRACELDYVYVPFEVAPDSLGAAVAGLKALKVTGFNVTIPHKTEVMKYLDDLDHGAVLAGAVNTVKIEAGRLTGYNTDGEGLVRSLVMELGFAPRAASIALVGAGGAARGAISALCRAGAGRVVVANRTNQKAVELVSMMAKQFPLTELTVAKDFEEMEELLAQADVLINTTSLGMRHDDGPVVRLDNLRQGAMVYDMVYTPESTRLLSDAHRLGFRYANGLGMLAAQGELGFAIWTGRMPPAGLMKSVLDGICNS